VGLGSRSGQARKISPPTGIRSQDRPARSESLTALQKLRSMSVQRQISHLSVIQHKDRPTTSRGISHFHFASSCEFSAPLVYTQVMWMW